MPDDVTSLVASAIFGDPRSDDGAGVTSPEASEDLLERAERAARTPRERQLVAIATEYVRGEHALVDVLAREHLADHPDSVLVARIAAAASCTDRTHEPPQSAVFE